MIIISENDVKTLLNWEETLKVIQFAFTATGQKKVVQNARSFTSVLNSPNVLLAMPGYLQDPTYGALACKLVTMCPGNACLPTPIPTILAHILLFNEETGALEAVIDGTVITAWRTAAASVLATQTLYKKKEFGKLAVLGSGTQGSTHAEAFYHFFRFKEVAIWNRCPQRSRIVCDSLNCKFNTCNVFRTIEDNEECVRDADVIITATYASSPIVQLNWIKKGAHVNAVGAGVSNHYSELDPATYQNCYLIVDTKEGAKSELAGLNKWGHSEFKDLGSVIDDPDSFKASSDQVTVFQNMGMAAEDAAMARYVYNKFTKSNK